MTEYLKFTLEDQKWFNDFLESNEFAEALGIVWALGSNSDGTFNIRHSKREIIERFFTLVRSRPLRSQTAYIQGNKNKPYEQWVSGMQAHHPFLVIVKNMGWAPINSENRPYPKGRFNEEIFCKTYIRLRHTLSTSYSRQKNYVRPQFYIHGSFDILTSISNFLTEQLGLTKKKIQNHSGSRVTKAIIYSSKVEVPKILRYIEAKDTLEKFKSLKLGYRDEF